MFLPRFLINKILDLADIPVPEQQQAMGRQTVPAGPPYFLVVVVNAFRQIIMDDKTDVGLVNPHAESDGRHDDPDIIPAEEILIFCPLCVRKPGVVGPHGITFPVEKGMQVICLLTGGAIDDPRFIAIPVQEVKNLLQGRRLQGHLQKEVRTIKAADKFMLRSDFQGFPDIFPDPRRGRGRQGSTDGSGKGGADICQKPVFRAEIVSPFGDAMGLVNGDAGHIQ